MKKCFLLIGLVIFSFFSAQAQISDSYGVASFYSNIKAGTLTNPGNFTTKTTAMYDDGKKLSSQAGIILRKENMLTTSQEYGVSILFGDEGFRFGPSFELSFGKIKTPDYSIENNAISLRINAIGLAGKKIFWGVGTKLGGGTQIGPFGKLSDPNNINVFGSATKYPTFHLGMEAKAGYIFSSRWSLLGDFRLNYISTGNSKEVGKGYTISTGGQIASTELEVKVQKIFGREKRFRLKLGGFLANFVDAGYSINATAKDVPIISSGNIIETVDVHATGGLNLRKIKNYGGSFTFVYKL